MLETCRKLKGQLPPVHRGACSKDVYNQKKMIFYFFRGGGPALIRRPDAARRRATRRRSGAGGHVQGPLACGRVRAVESKSCTTVGPPRGCRHARAATGHFLPRPLPPAPGAEAAPQRAAAACAGAAEPPSRGARRYQCAALLDLPLSRRQASRRAQAPRTRRGAGGHVQWPLARGRVQQS